MHEYTVNDPAPNHQVRNTRDYVRLDDWVLCKIYKKIKKPNDVRNRQRDQESSPLSAIDDVNSVNHHGEDRTDLPVMDSGHAGEIDNAGAGAVFADAIASKRLLQGNLLHKTQEILFLSPATSQILLLLATSPRLIMFLRRTVFLRQIVLLLATKSCNQPVNLASKVVPKNSLP